MQPAFINIGEKLQCLIRADMIRSVQDMESYPARQAVSDAKQNGKFINGTGRDKANSAIVLTDGYVAASALPCDKIQARINAAYNK